MTRYWKDAWRKRLHVWLYFHMMQWESSLLGLQCCSRMLCGNITALCNTCNLIFQMSSCSFPSFSAALSLKNMILLRVFVSGHESLYQNICPSPDRLFNHMFTLSCLSRISFLPLCLPTSCSSRPLVPRPFLDRLKDGWGRWRGWVGRLAGRHTR